MMGLGKPKLCIKFEVTSFSHCVNIKKEPHKFWGATLVQGYAPFPSLCDFMMVVGKRGCAPNLKLLASAVAETL